MYADSMFDKNSYNRNRCESMNWYKSFLREEGETLQIL